MIYKNIFVELVVGYFPPVASVGTGVSRGDVLSPAKDYQIIADRPFCELFSKLWRRCSVFFSFHVELNDR